jgi:GNAT superfamily N-acetyltransferase
MQQPKPTEQIRRANPSDLPDIIRVTNAAFSVETFIEGTRTDDKRIGEMLHDGEFLVAVDETDRIRASVYVEQSGSRGYFGMLAVDPKRQGKGLGHAMIDAAEQWCRDRGCKQIDITVLNLRPELLPLYRHLGYIEAGTEDFHPSRPLKPGVECHCIVMLKML